MKILLCLFFMMTTTAMSSEGVDLGCVTEVPTTSMLSKTTNGTVVFEWIHHNGVKFMPIHNGVITPNDLSTLSDRADLLADLGDYLRFEVPAGSCKSDDVLFDCFGKSTVQEINGHKVHLWAAYSSWYEEKSFAGAFAYITTNLAIEVDGKSFFLPMRYSENECELDWFNKKSFKKLFR